MGAEIVGGEVAFGPGEELVETGTIVIDEREEECVALAFRSRAIAALRVEYTTVIADETVGIRLPQARMVDLRRGRRSLSLAAQQAREEAKAAENAGCARWPGSVALHSKRFSW